MAHQDETKESEREKIVDCIEVSEDRGIVIMLTAGLEDVNRVMNACCITSPSATYLFTNLSTDCSVDAAVANTLLFC